MKLIIHNDNILLASQRRKRKHTHTHSYSHKTETEILFHYTLTVRGHQSCIIWHSYALDNKLLLKIIHFHFIQFGDKVKYIYGSFLWLGYYTVVSV